MAGAVGIVFGLCVLSFTLGAALMYVLVRRREDAASDDSAPAEVADKRTWVSKPATVEPVDDEYDSRPIHRNPVMGLRQMEPALASLAEPVVERPRLQAAPEPEPVAKLEPVAKPDLVVKREQGAKPEQAAKLEQVAEPGKVAKLESVAKLSPGAELEPVAALDPIAKLDPAVDLIAQPDPTAELGSVATQNPAVDPVVKPEPVAAPKTVGAAGYDWDGDLDPPLGEPEAPESIVAASTDTSGQSHTPEVPRTPELSQTPEVPQTPDLPPPASPQPVEHTTWVEREDFRQRYLRTFEEVRRKAGSN